MDGQNKRLIRKELTESKQRNLRENIRQGFIKLVKGNLQINSCSLFPLYSACCWDRVYRRGILEGAANFRVLQWVETDGQQPAEENYRDYLTRIGAFYWSYVYDALL